MSDTEEEMPVCCVGNTEQEGQVQHSGGGRGEIRWFPLFVNCTDWWKSVVSPEVFTCDICSVRRRVPWVWKVKWQSYPSLELYALSPSFTPQLSYQWGKNPRYPLYGRPGEPGSGREDKVVGSAFHGTSARRPFAVPTERKMLRRILWHKREEVKGSWRKLCNEWLHSSYSAWNVWSD